MDWICSYSCDFLLCKALCNYTGHRKCVFPQVLALQTQRFHLLFHFLCTNCKHVVEDTCTQFCWIQILCKHKFLSYIVTLSCYSDIAVYIMISDIVPLYSIICLLLLKRHILQQSMAQILDYSPSKTDSGSAFH